MSLGIQTLARPKVEIRHRKSPSAPFPCCLCLSPDPIVACLDGAMLRAFGKPPSSTKVYFLVRIDARSKDVAGRGGGRGGETGGGGGRGGETGGGGGGKSRGISRTCEPVADCLGNARKDEERTAGQHLPVNSIPVSAPPGRVYRETLISFHLINDNHQSWASTIWIQNALCGF